MAGEKHSPVSLPKLSSSLLRMETDEGQSQNIYKIRKYFKSCFLEIIVEEFIRSQKLLQILIKLLNPQILFGKSQTSLEIQELLLNPEKYFANPVKYCHILLAPAVSQH